MYIYIYYYILLLLLLLLLVLLLVIHISLNLPARFDLLRDNRTVLSNEMNLLAVHDRTARNTKKFDLFRPIAHAEALIGQKENAVSLLLDTPTTHRDFYINSLHACVISASLGDPVHFQHTVRFPSFSSRGEQKQQQQQ